MKLQADRNIVAIEFEVGDWVLVKLQPYRQFTVAHRLNNKLAQRYFSPLKIKKKLSAVAYQLELPKAVESIIPSILRSSRNSKESLLLFHKNT